MDSVALGAAERLPKALLINVVPERSQFYSDSVEINECLTSLVDGYDYTTRHHAISDGFLKDIIKSHFVSLCRSDETINCDVESGEVRWHRLSMDVAPKQSGGDKATSQATIAISLTPTLTLVKPSR